MKAPKNPQPERKAPKIKLDELKRKDFAPMTSAQLGASLRKAVTPAKSPK